jgi:hypothetical protein
MGEGEVEKDKRVEAIKGIVSSLFASQRALRALAPEYKWAGLGNLLGDFGEFIATHEYGLAKASAGSNGYDARTRDGRSVQVKTNHAASQIGFRGNADLMLVLHVQTSGEWEEIYFGPFAAVKEASRHSARDNKEMIAISKLKMMKKILETQDAGVAVSFAKAMPDVASASAQED